MNDDDSLKDLGFIRIHFQLKPDQIEFLKTIDPASQSNALRIVIDRYRKQMKMMKFDKLLLYFIFVVCIIIFVIMILPIIGL